MPDPATPVISGFNNSANLQPGTTADVWGTGGWATAPPDATARAMITELEMTIVEAFSQVAQQLAKVVVELRVTQKMLQAGLNTADEPEAVRRDVVGEMGPDAPVG